MCPECGSNNIRVEPYDYGVCRETGYHDAGERYTCRNCGGSGDADDLGCASVGTTGPKSPARFAIA